MTTFDKREEGFEKKFAHDEELRFKANARRNRLLGAWAAGHLGFSGADADAYAKEVVMADFEEAGDEDVFRKIRKDFMGSDASTPANEVGTFRCRALHSNHMAGHLYAEYGSETLRSRPVVPGIPERTELKDNGRGYYCWCWPEEQLEYFHGYDEGYAGRVRIQ